MPLSVVPFALQRTSIPFCCIAFFGMLNARGKDRGVAVILETAILPSLEDPKNRTKAFGWLCHYSRMWVLRWEARLPVYPL